MPRAGLTELGEVIRDAVQGQAGRDALAALLSAVRGYVSAHPGRYMATTGVEFTRPDDPLLAAVPASSTRSPPYCAATASPRTR